MKKLLALAAVAFGAAYAQRKMEQQRSEKDLFAAASAGKTSAKQNQPKDVWAAATDSRP